LVTKPKNEWSWRSIMGTELAVAAKALSAQLGRKVRCGDADVDITTSCLSWGMPFPRQQQLPMAEDGMRDEHFARLIGAMQQCVAQGPTWLALELVGGGHPVKHRIFHSRKMEARNTQTAVWKALARCGYSWPRLVGKVKKLQWAVMARCGERLTNRQAVSLLADRGVKNAVRWVSWKAVAAGVVVLEARRAA